MIVIVSKSYYSSHLDHKILNIFLNKKKKKWKIRHHLVMEHVSQCPAPFLTLETIRGVSKK